MNKRCVLALLLFALLPGRASCQVAVGLSFPDAAYVRFEPVKAAVRIRNDTDAVFVLGGVGEAAVLNFQVRTRDQTRVKRRRSGLIVENIVVLPGETKEVSVDVSAHYDLRSAGQYHIRAEVVTGKARHLSEAQVIDVVPGLELQTVERAVPSDPTSMRTYKLLYWTRGDAEHLFLLVTDKEQRTCYGIFDLGRLLRFVPPTLSVDVSGNVVVKHQPAHDVIALTSLQSRPEGVTLLRQESKAVVTPAE